MIIIIIIIIIIIVTDYIVYTYHWRQSHCITVHPCQPKVCNLHLSGYWDQDVLWFQISVDDPIRVQKIHTI